MCSGSSGQSSPRGRSNSSDRPILIDVIGHAGVHFQYFQYFQATGIETAVITGMAGGADLINHDEHRIAVTVERHRLDQLDMAGGVAFDSVLSP